MVIHQESVLPSFLTLVEDICELAEDGVLSELLYTDGLVLMNETIDGLQD